MWVVAPSVVHMSSTGAPRVVNRPGLATRRGASYSDVSVSEQGEQESQ